MPRQLFDELAGLDERFTSPGGGLVNLDFYQRALALQGVQLVTLLGEASFHQVHGGATTAPQNRWKEMTDEYQRIRGIPCDPYPRPWPRSEYLRQLPRSVFPWLKDAIRRRQRFYATVKGNPHQGSSARPAAGAAGQRPRTLFCLEGWLEVLPQMQLVGIVRHPESVARSLQARNGFPLEEGLDLWWRYNLRLQQWLNQYQAPLLHFDDDLNGFLHQASGLIRLLQLPQQLRAAAIKFADPALQHQSSQALELPTAVDDLYRALRAYAAGSPWAQPPRPLFSQADALMVLESRSNP